MIRGVCEKPDPFSDRQKAIQDFICYASINLTWFALNFVLCIMPALCVFWLQNPDLTIQGFSGSYAPIMYVLLGTQVLAFFCKLRIYKIVMPKAKVGGDDDY